MQPLIQAEKSNAFNAQFRNPNMSVMDEMEEKH